MSSLLLYGLEIDDLADLAGDFNATKFEENEQWILRQWRRYADVLGFRRALDRHLQRKSPRKRMVNADALQAFKQWHRQQSHDGRDPELARVRAGALKHLRKLSPSNLWLPAIDSADLPESACYTPYDLRGEAVSGDPLVRVLGMRPAVQPRKRVFRPDVTASFYHEQDPRRPPEGCSYLVKLSLGTFPYVYGRQLAQPPGMQWAPTGNFDPAAIAMRFAASMWSQTGNLSQDARVVAKQYQHFRRWTAKALDRHTRDARDPKTGKLKRAIPRVVDARGSLNAKGYTLVLKAFAAFFAARRAYLRSPRTFTPATYRAIRQNPDPLLRDALGMSES